MSLWFFFFFNNTATTEIYTYLHTLALHDALPIYTGGGFDGIFFEGTVTREQLSFSRDGDDLLISIDNNTTPAARVTNHFLGGDARSEEHTSELQSLMRISYAVFCLKKKK